MPVKKTALLLIVLLIFSLLSACTGTDTDTSSTEPAATDEPVATEAAATESSQEDSLLTEAGTYPIVNEPVTLEIFTRLPSNIEDYNTNEFTLYLEELTGVDIEFITAPSDSATEKMNLLMTSGDYPGVFMTNIPDETTYGVDEGILIDLTELIETQMPNFSTELDKDESLIGQIKAVDGNIYTLPGINATYHLTFARKMWVNTYWLEQMGVDAPTTTEEFYEVCKQFIELNPDGIALTGGTYGNGDPTVFLTGAFTFYSGGTGASYGLRLQGDAVETMITSDGYRQALQYMNMLYEEGLLYESTFTMDSSQAKALVASEGEPVLFIAGMYPGYFIDYTVAENYELYSHYYALEPLEGPEGAQYAAKNIASISAKYAVTDACEYPEVAVRLADYFYTVEGYLTKEIGFEGIDWKWADEGSVGLNGDAAIYERITAYTNELQNRTWTNESIHWASSTVKNSEVSDPDVDIYAANGLVNYLFSVTTNLYAIHDTDEYAPLQALKFLSDESEELSTISVEVENYISQSKVDFITGTMDIDDDDEWNAYVEALDNIGINTLIEVYQTAYDRQYN